MATKYIINTLILDPYKVEKTATTLTEARIEACKIAKTRQSNYGYRIAIRDPYDVGHPIEIIHYEKSGFYMEKNTGEWYRISPTTGRLLKKE